VGSPGSVRQDIGDDYITFARDLAAPDDTDVAWDLSAPVLMQIKASSTEYLKPKNKRRGDPGWWFAESDTDHFDHWLAFGLPYLLVLVDTTNQIAYWAEVRGPAIEKTGKGRKIWVPASQTVDEGHPEALNQVAVSRRSNRLEGSAWTGRFADLSPADRLRHALVMPRLVAPHGNNSPEVIDYEEAAAMLMRSRFSELNYRAKHQGACPPPEEWAGHKEWGWRFVAALQTTARSSRTCPMPRGRASWASGSTTTRTGSSSRSQAAARSPTWAEPAMRLRAGSSCGLPRKWTKVRRNPVAPAFRWTGARDGIGRLRPRSRS
jgi:hypothetical protein